MAVAQVQIINGQKVLVPVSGNAPVNVVQSGNNNPVSSNAVDMLHSTRFGYYQGVDVLTTAENQPLDKVSFMRIFEATANSPYGSNSNDFYYYVNRIGDPNYMQIIAYDVRSSNVFIRTKINGTWEGWYSLQRQEVANNF